MPHARRVDANHAEVASAFRSLGCQVLDLSRVGHDVPDLLVRVPGCGLHLVEVKDGGKPAYRRRLSQGQREFADLWGSFVITTVEQAFELVRRLRAGVLA